MSDSAELDTSLVTDQAEVLQCAKCKAPLMFDPKGGGLKCSYCGASIGIPRDGPLPMHPIEQGLKVRHRPHLPTKKRVVCPNCGASSIIEEDHLALQCIFCLATLTPASEAADLAEFDAIAPFKVDNEGAKAAFQHWLGKTWFAPNALTRLSNIENVRATYVPIWRFSAHVHSDWTAQLGSMEGDDEHRHFVAKGAIRGEHEADYKDLFIAGSTVLTPGPILWPDLRTTAESAVPFHRGYLAGFDAELPARTIDAAWKEALEKVRKSEELECDELSDQEANRVDDSNNKQGLHVTSVPTHGDYLITLVPLYIVAYRFKGKIYRVLINGQSGDGNVDYPLSWVKLAPFVAALTAGLLFLVYLFYDILSAGHH